MSTRSINFVGFAIPDGSTPRFYANTKAGLRCSNGLRLPSGSIKFCTYTSVHLENGDVCSVGDWVLVKSDVTDPVVCRIEEILSPRSPDGRIPQLAHAVLLQSAVVTWVTNPYCMPKVFLQRDEFFLQPPAVSALSPLNGSMAFNLSQEIICALNVQHDCITHKCGSVAQGFVRQERQATSVKEQGIHHVNPSDLVLNTAKMRDVIHTHQFRARLNEEDIDLAAAIFDGIKSEIDKRKGTVVTQDSSDVTQQGGARTRGRRVSQHVVGNRRSSEGRQRGR